MYTINVQKIISDTKEQDLQLSNSNQVSDQSNQEPIPREAEANPESARRSEFPTPPGIEMSEIFPGVVKPVTERVVYEWYSPSRVFKKRKKQYFTNFTTIVLLLSLILFFSGQAMAVAVILSVAFMAYVMTSVPPHSVTQKITTYGVRLEDKIYYWQEMGRFWFETKSGQIVLKIEVTKFPNQLSLVVNNETEKLEISRYLSDVLLQQKPEPTIADKFGDWLAKKFPIDLEGV